MRKICFIVRRTVIFECAKVNKWEQNDDVERFFYIFIHNWTLCIQPLKMQLDQKLTLKKATDITRQSMTVKKQQDRMRNENKRLTCLN